jgi:hypothetical protein
MARQIRIDALAEQCGVAPREILRVLIELGEFRYTRFNQQLNDDLAQQVRATLSPAEPAERRSTPEPEVGDLFARAMNAAGVQPLGGRDGKPSAKKRAKPGKKPRSRAASTPAPEPAPPAAPAPEPAPPAAPAPEPQAVPAPEPPVAPAPEPPVAPELPAALQAEPPALSEAEPTASPAELAPTEPEGPRDPASLEALQAELTAMRDEREALLREQRLLRSELAEAGVRCDELQELATQLSSSSGEGLPGQGLMDLMRGRGLVGVDEVGFTLRALLSAHLLDSSLPLLRSLDGGRLERLLRDRLCLCCGAEGCGSPAGVELVRVPARRCELCGGRDLPRAHDRFSDACLLSGITRVLLVGGQRWQHHWIEAGLHRRLELRCWAAGPGLDASSLAADLRWAQIALRWKSGPTPAWDATVETAAARLELEAGSAGELMGRAVEAIEGLDPADLP